MFYPKTSVGFMVDGAGYAYHMGIPHWGQA